VGAWPGAGGAPLVGGLAVEAAQGAVSGVRWDARAVAGFVLLRRQDEAVVIGAAIEAHVAGEGHRPIASRLGVPAGTVRGWLRRFAERAGLIRALFTRCAVALDPELGPIVPAGSGIADALEAVAVAARAWVLRFGPRPVWQIVSRLSAGGLLSRNTSSLATAAW
jgi:hypothetical protein